MTDQEEKKSEAINRFRERFGKLKTELGRLIVGQEDIIDFTLMAMVAGGHVLIEGVPGLGKTLLVKSISDALDLSFKRVQFTPDLMPADLIGTKVLIDDAPSHTRFEFVKGPLFCNLLLADEINRATPKTQSALLEAMQEKAITVAGETHRLTPPYFVLATQNPIEQEGTYPLPEAQLDRFFFKLNVQYPSQYEFEMILNRTTEKEIPEIHKVFAGDKLIEMGRLAREVPVPPFIKQRAVELVMATHPETDWATDTVKRYIRFGASPRAGQCMLLSGKIRALLDNRYHVATEDLCTVAVPVLNHRIILNFEAQAEGITAESLLEKLIEEKRDEWEEK